MEALVYIDIRPDFKFGTQSISDSCGQASMAIVNHLSRKEPCYNGTTLYATSRLRQNNRRFPVEIFKRLILNENLLIQIEISLKFVFEGVINNIPALVYIMAWRLTGDKPLSEPMMTYSIDAYMRHSVR